MKYILVLLAFFGGNLYAEALSPDSLLAKKCVESAPFLTPDLLQKGRGKVTLFLGTSTAGKTTHMNKLYAKNPQLLDYGVDPTFYRGVERLIARRHAHHYSAIKKVTSQFVFKLLDRKEKPRDKLVLLKGSTEADIAEARKSIAYFNEEYKNDALIKYHAPIISSAFQEIIMHSQQGRDVVVDMVSIERAKELFYRGFCAPFEIVLVFCPFDELSKRLLKRNEEAKRRGVMSNYRGIAPFQEYVKLYKPAQKMDEPVVETLKKDEAIKAIRRHKVTAEEEKEFLLGLGFIKPEITQVNVSPRFKGYDRLLGVQIKQ